MVTKEMKQLHKGVTQLKSLLVYEKKKTCITSLYQNTPLFKILAKTKIDLKRSLQTTEIRLACYIGETCSKLPFRSFFLQDEKYTTRKSNAVDITATNDPRIITSKALLSLS